MHVLLVADGKFALHSVVVATVSLLLTWPAYGTDLNVQKQALDIISDFADRICTRIPLEQRTQSIELSGEAKAELKGVLRKIANLGVAGTAEYQSGESQGILQKDLAEAIRNSDNCRVSVLHELRDRILPRTEEVIGGVLPSENRGETRLAIGPTKSLFDYGLL
jgi:hypothetical protein